MRKLVILCLAVGLAVASNFYIFYKQVGAYPNCPGLSIDANNNAPAHSKWAMDASGGFSEDATQGDWLIRAVLNWTPQNVNASTIWFATNMPNDTLPNINFQIRATIKNMGNDTLPVGMPVRLDITGPAGYEYQDTVLTTAKLARRATAQMNFSPAWHIPNTDGVYNIKVWTEAAGEQWPYNDTIAYDLSCAKWIQYCNEAALHWVTWAGPMRAVQFDPDTFNIPYPVGLTRVRTDFYLSPQRPWPDSSFLFDIYADDGATLLYESETLEAIPGTPGAWTAYSLDSMLIFPSGTFWVAIQPVSGSGLPSTCGDTSAGGHSYQGAPGGWTPWVPPGGGELFISAAVQGGVGLASSEQWIGRSENPHYAIPDPSAAAQGSVGLASSEQWIGRGVNPHYAIPNPQPGIFPSAPGVFTDAADTLKYDDNMAANAWAQNVAGGGWGVKFISPGDSVTLAGALINFYSGWPDPGGTLASVRVYADDGVNGAPGTELFARDSVTITMGAWNYIPLVAPAVEEGYEPGLNSPSLRITNYPNPVTDQVTLKWQVPSRMPLSVNLYDATGRMMRNLYTANDKARVGMLTVDTKSLAAGIYLVRLETPKGSATRKLVIDR